ncbi:MAG TPA: hypothetical protein VFV58_04240 [Blastocatellia bacterium]|jgi:hypothetical protein|nr:hypothetical protein [Blastocatellia bacterium]
MNQVQGIILFFGLIMIVILCLCPPYQWENATYLINDDTSVPHKAEVNVANIGHCWIWSPPQGWTEETYKGYHLATISHVAAVDWPRLGVYVGLTTVVALFGAFIVFNDRLVSKDKKP